MRIYIEITYVQLRFHLFICDHVNKHTQSICQEIVTAVPWQALSF